MNDLTFSPFKSGRASSLLLLGGFVVSELVVMAVSLRFPLEVLSALLGIGLLWYISKNTFAGLCTLILLHYFVIRTSEEISLPEIFFALSFCAVLGTWFFRKIFLARQAILLDRLDYALTGFLLFCVLSLIPAILFGSSPMKWLRELVPFMTLLLVFPLREEVDSPRRVKIMLACFLLLSLIVAINSLISYKQAIASALQLWELLASRRAANEPVFLICVVVSGGFFVLAKNIAIRILALLFVIFFGLTLAITFSRGYWVAAFVGMIALFWYAPQKYKLRISVYFGSLVLVSSAVAFLFFGEVADFIINAIGQRFQTVGGASQDLSFATRLAEWQTVIAQIKENPIVGYGLGRAYSYDSPIPMEFPTWYVHNTVLFVWYKIGLLGLICLLIFIGGIFIRCLRLYKAETDKFLKALLLGLLAGLTSLIFVSFTSPQLLEKSSSLTVALICGLVQAMWVRRLETESTS